MSPPLVAIARAIAAAAASARPASLPAPRRRGEFNLSRGDEGANSGELGEEEEEDESRSALIARMPLDAAAAAAAPSSAVPPPPAPAPAGPGRGGDEEEDGEDDKAGKPLERVVPSLLSASGEQGRSRNPSGRPDGEDWNNRGERRQRVICGTGGG